MSYKGSMKSEGKKCYAIYLGPNILFDMEATSEYEAMSGFRKLFPNTWYHHNRDLKVKEVI